MATTEKAVEKKELSADDKFELLIAALASKPTGITKDDLAEILAGNAQQFRKAMRPENDISPNVSVFHPDGGPFRTLPFECLYNGFPVHKFPETHHDRELELLAQVQPGEYTVFCKDLSLMKVTVRAKEYDAHGKVTKMEITYPVTRDTKSQIPSMFMLLYQVVHGGNLQESFQAASAEYLQMLWRKAS